MNAQAILYHGVDGLDVTFQGALPASTRSALASARAAAEEARGAVSLELGGLALHVQPSGWPGGYRYVIWTGDDGEYIGIAENGDDERWNIRVSVQAQAFLVHGFMRVRDRLYERLEALGATIRQESLARIDYAVDLDWPGFALDPGAFVAHSRTSIGEHGQPQVMDGAIAWRGRRVESVTLGKMPGRQVIAYDKRAEAIQKVKWHWFDVWGLDRQTRKEPVWRVEVRAGKDALAAWDMRTWAELNLKFGDFVAKTLRDVRLTDPGDAEPNPTRKRVHPLWQTVTHALTGALEGARSGAAPRKHIRGTRATLRQLYERLILGLAATYAVASYEGALGAERRDKIYADVAALIDSEIRDRPKEWRKRLARADSRLELVSESHTVGGVPHDLTDAPADAHALSL